MKSRIDFNKIFLSWPVQILILLSLVMFATWDYPNLGPRVDNSKIDYAALTKDGKDIPITYDFYEVFPLHFNQYFHPWYAVESYRVEFFRPITNIYFWILYKLGVSNIQQHYYVNIAAFMVIVILYWSLLRYLGLQPWLCLAGGLLMVADFHYYEIASWPQAACYFVSLFFGILSLLSFLKALKGRHFYLWISLCSILWLLAVFSVEIGFSFLFLLFPLITLLPDLRRRLLAITFLSFAAIAYLTTYLLHGHGAKSEAYLDPISSLSGYLTRLTLFYPDYFIKKLTFDRATYFEPLQPALFYWILFTGIILLAVYIFRLAHRKEIFKKPFLIFMMSTFLHPILLSTTIVTSRSLSILSLTFNFFILSILALSLNWKTHWRNLVFVATLFVLVFGYYKSVKFADEDPFFNETTVCIENLKSYESHQLQKNSLDHYTSLNGVPFAYHWNISDSLKNRIQGQPLTDIHIENLEVSKIGPKTLQIRSKSPRGLVQFYQPYLYEKEFFMKNIFNISGTIITVSERLESGMPKSIIVEFMSNLSELKFIAWDQYCKWHELTFK